MKSRRAGKSQPVEAFKSPLDAESIGPGDPGWEIFAPFLREDPPDAMYATYDKEGTILSTQEIRREES